MTLCCTSVSVVLGLALGNSFDASIGSLLFYSVDLAFGTLVGTSMGPLLGNYLGRSLEAFLGFPLYFYLLVTPSSWELINILDDNSFLSPNFAFFAQRRVTNFSEPPPPEEAQ